VARVSLQARIAGSARPQSKQPEALPVRRGSCPGCACPHLCRQAAVVVLDKAQSPAHKVDVQGRRPAVGRVRHDQCTCVSSDHGRWKRAPCHQATGLGGSGPVACCTSRKQTLTTVAAGIASPRAALLCWYGVLPGAPLPLTRSLTWVSRVPAVPHIVYHVALLDKPTCRPRR